MKNYNVVIIRTINDDFITCLGIRDSLEAAYGVAFTDILALSNSYDPENTVNVEYSISDYTQLPYDGNTSTAKSNGWKFIWTIDETDRHPKLEIQYYILFSIEV